MKINNTLPDEQIFLKRLQHIANAPKSLYYIGNLPQTEVKCVAIVGSRRPTAYGKAVTELITESLASHGIYILSGLALGVDAIAHTAALKVDGHTIAVVPSGLDDPYPRSNHQLARRILEHGDALIGEYENGYRPHEYDFLRRNRIVSGLADAVIVTEANIRSGTMSTVAHALEQGRTVYAVPGPITSPLSAGCNKLIAQGARPVTDIETLLDEFGCDDKQPELFGDTPEEAFLIKLVKSGVSDGEELLAQSAIDAQLFAQTLTMCEIKGSLKPLGGNKWRV